MMGRGIAQLISPVGTRVYRPVMTTTMRGIDKSFCRFAVTSHPMGGSVESCRFAFIVG